MTPARLAAGEPSPDDLVLQHMPVVSFCVNAVLPRLPRHVRAEDLTSAGNLALVKAARTYDSSTGVPFRRWAALRVRGAILDELRAMDWVSRGGRQRMRALTAAGDRLAGELGRLPTRGELAVEAGLTPSGVDAARADSALRLVSVEAFDGALADLVIEPSRGPEDVALAGELERYLRAAVAALPARTRRVIEGLYFEDLDTAALAGELGVQPSRISQIRGEGLALVRDALNASLDPLALSAPANPGGAADRRRRAYYAAVAAAAATSGAAAAAHSAGARASDPRAWVREVAA